MPRLRDSARRRMARGMTEKRRNAQAGGIFLFLAPIIGLLYGIGRGDPIKWLLVGFVIGLAIAIGVWLVDRRKDPG